MITVTERSSLNDMDPATAARWAEIPTPIISDVRGGRGLLDRRIRAVAAGGPGTRLVGPAVTALCEPPDFGAVLHAIAEANAGEVLVIATDGRCDYAVLGELLGGAARAKGLLGVICDGSVRDVGTLGKWVDFPVFARSATARGPMSKEGGVVHGAVSCGGVRIESGDLIVADEDGVIAIPVAEAGDALKQSEARLLDEQEWQRQLQSGRSLIDVFNVPDARRQPIT